MPYSSTAPSLPARSMHMYWRPYQELGRKQKSQALYMMPAGVPHTAVRARLVDNDIDKITPDSHPTSVVKGVLFESADLADFWQTLDDFEGTEYQAEITTAHLVTGEYRRCVVYTVLAG